MYRERERESLICLAVVYYCCYVVFLFMFITFSVFNVCRYMYIHIYVYTHTLYNTCVYIYIYIYTHMYTHMYMYVFKPCPPARVV